MYEQKERYLNMLDVLYGENTLEICKQYLGGTTPERNEKRIKLIRLFLQFNANRFRSFNILDSSPKNVPVIKQTVASVLGYDLYAETSITNLFTRYNLRLISDEQFFHQSEVLSNIEFLFEDVERNWLEHRVERVPDTNIRFNERRFFHVKRQLNLFWHNLLFESFLRYGSDVEYYRMAFEPDKHGFILLFKHPQMERWLNMGFFIEKDTLIETANLLWKFVQRLNLQSSSFYLVEHILLDTGDTDFTGTDNHLLSVILPVWSEQFQKKDRFKSVLRERLPAHLSICYLGLDADSMYHFEKIYFSWRHAMAERKEDEIYRLSTKLRSFLQERDKKDEYNREGNV